MGSIVRRPFPLLGVMPLVLRDVVLDFLWDPERLWQLDLPVLEVPIAELRWHLRLPMWAFEDKPFVVTPEQVAADPRCFREHFARTLAADLDFPLHVLHRPERLTILDGMHRLLKAHLAGHDTVFVKKVAFRHLGDIAQC